MKKILFFIFLLAVQVGHARNNPDKHKPSGDTPKVDFRADCQVGEDDVDLAVNNVRARLLSRGDFWWDYNEAKYIVPAVSAGVEEVSSIFAGAVWMGGFDDAGNLKLAASDYASNGNTDFYPGPLDVNEGTTDASVCSEWDRHFKVEGANITKFKNLWKSAKASGETLTESDIPEDLKFYPARGNPYFATQANGFILPDQDLASFHDEEPTDGVYNPLDGDYPVIEIRGCPDTNYADQIYFQIYNDNGGPHTKTNGSAIRMEVQVQAFGYATADELNDMTFMRYKLINRAVDTIKDCYFAMWVDADLGCSDDDYIGSDTLRALAYYYNADDADGKADGSCVSNGTSTPTYGRNIPMIGVDYFRGPLGDELDMDDKKIELGMSSFTYINRSTTIPAPPGGTTDPISAIEYYNLLTGKWKDGSDVYGGDDGYQDPDFDVIRYAFPSRPNDPAGWSMAQEGLIPGDRRTVQASGPFTLDPGTTNELIIGLPWVPNVKHPVPDITKLLAADDKAQNLFDNCFKLMDGPDAPDMDIVELDQEVVISLQNRGFTNNPQETYHENDIAHEGEQYLFEGYQIFQTIAPDVSLSNLTDPQYARLVAQTDVRNGVTELYNWVPAQVNPDPSNPIQLYEPVLMASEIDTTMDIGIRRSFSFKNNAFGSADERLVNHRKYYFVAIAYAHNNFKQFDPNNSAVGQSLTYLIGRKSGFGTKIRPITAIPRPSTYTNLGARYGEGPIVTRISGYGTGGNFLKVSKEERERLFSISDGNVKYMPGMAPFTVKVVNPLLVKGGKFRISVIDNTGNTMPHDIANETLNWKLEELDDSGNVVNTIYSEKDMDYITEQVLTEYGISIALNNIAGVGEATAFKSGSVGLEVAYGDDEKPFWLITANDDSAVFLDFVVNGTSPEHAAFAKQSDRDVAFYPFFLLNSVKSNANSPYFITPSWINSKSSKIRDKDSLYHLNNVDIVMTADKSKWSRCIVVETANSHYGSEATSIKFIKTEGGREQFQLRAGTSVDQNGNAEAGTGMGWFPGYAIDIESGRRLNIFFGENSTYRNDEDFPGVAAFEDDDTEPRGGDMLFNPSSIGFVNTGNVTGTNMPYINSFYLGGQHFVYVTNREYDECAKLKEALKEGITDTKRGNVLSQIQWAGLPMLAQGQKLLSAGDGLIPNDVVISLRATKEYNTRDIYSNIKDLAYGANPTYEFDLGELQPSPITESAAVDVALENISVVPNPYYGFSEYEADQFGTIVKITNLPAKCTVTIYSLDGKFIKKFDRNEEPFVDAVTKNVRQISPDLEWNLKNASDIPIASGVYIIHVDAPGVGEKVIKWFGINRQFDPSGL